jgi:hypothetical protein
MSSLAQFLTTSPSGSDLRWRVPATTSPILILSSSQDQRSHASIFNDSPSSLYLVLGGAGPSVSVTGTYDLKLTSGSYYEVPKPTYQGEIWGIWDGPGGFARVMQLGVGR